MQRLDARAVPIVPTNVSHPARPYPFASCSDTLDQWPLGAQSIDSIPRRGGRVALSTRFTRQALRPAH